MHAEAITKSSFRVRLKLPWDRFQWLERGGKSGWKVVIEPNSPEDFRLGDPILLGRAQDFLRVLLKHLFLLILIQFQMFSTLGFREDTEAGVGVDGHTLEPEIYVCLLYTSPSPRDS